MGLLELVPAGQLPAEQADEPVCCQVFGSRRAGQIPRHKIER